MKRNCTIHVAKTKALICIFVFAKTNVWFSHMLSYSVSAGVVEVGGGGLFWDFLVKLTKKAHHVCHSIVTGNWTAAEIWIKQ